ncbi:probable neutral amino acid permease [Melanopsichium pennsylvanicum]|uniref:Probable neutral amino acid permease n=2 Tax=Melanopsichium pennsylvanicum TaxID=63383 RepID=A0AAJ4XFW6_9BASI|nr:probable neutral amino acid permease [Melanopsichium pennsylvanicum 4]SNX81357.1 probable neutral amino acid permease [Melanopsichium pennsylvanicum]
MASTGHLSPNGDRSSRSVSPTLTVDADKTGTHDGIKPHDDGPKMTSSEPVPQTVFGEKREQYRSEEDYMYEQQKLSEGDHRFHRLGWKKLTVCLIVEAIALGALSIPSAFATLGMVAGVIVCVGVGIIAIYTSFIVGQVKIKFPHISHYADAGQLMMGRFGYELVGAMFALQLTLLVGSHCLTGTIAFLTLSSDALCSVVFGVISAIILFIVAVPPTFSEVAVLGYIDFASIIVAIGVTIIGTGIRSNNVVAATNPTEWSAWPKPGTTFAEAWVALTNIVFAYSFAVCQFSFMDEMHTPTDYVKSIWALGIIEIVIYTLTGALIYAFVGTDVASPALLSAGTTLSKVAFGIALPVIFISGSINTTVVARYIHGRVFKDSIIRYVNTFMGWATWLGLVAFITVIAFVIAEAIPFFSELLGIMSALFISGFTFYFPALMWFLLIKEGKWNATRWNTILSVVNAAVFVLGLLILGCGTYASVKGIVDEYNNGTVRGSFTCKPID